MDLPDLPDRAYFLFSSILFFVSMEVDESDIAGRSEQDDSERLEKVGESKAWPTANQKLTNQVSGQE
jgi:hypothetical protein